MFGWGEVLGGLSLLSSGLRWNKVFYAVKGAQILYGSYEKSQYQLKNKELSAQLSHVIDDSITRMLYETGVISTLEQNSQETTEIRHLLKGLLRNIPSGYQTLSAKESLIRSYDKMIVDMQGLVDAVVQQKSKMQQNIATKAHQIDDIRRAVNEHKHGFSKIRTRAWGPTEKRQNKRLDEINTLQNHLGQDKAKLTVLTHDEATLKNKIIELEQEKACVEQRLPPEELRSTVSQNDRLHESTLQRFESQTEAELARAQILRDQMRFNAIDLSQTYGLDSFLGPDGPQLVQQTAAVFRSIGMIGMNPQLYAVGAMLTLTAEANGQTYMTASGELARKPGIFDVMAMCSSLWEHGLDAFKGSYVTAALALSGPLVSTVATAAALFQQWQYLCDKKRLKEQANTQQQQFVRVFSQVAQGVLGQFLEITQQQTNLLSDKFQQMENRLETGIARIGFHNKQQLEQITQKLSRIQNQIDSIQQGESEIAWMLGRLKLRLNDNSVKVDVSELHKMVTQILVLFPMLGVNAMSRSNDWLILQDYLQDKEIMPRDGQIIIDPQQFLKPLQQLQQLMAMISIQQLTISQRHSLKLIAEWIANTQQFALMIGSNPTLWEKLFKQYETLFGLLSQQVDSMQSVVLEQLFSRRIVMNLRTLRRECLALERMRKHLFPLRLVNSLLPWYELCADPKHYLPVTDSNTQPVIPINFLEQGDDNTLSSWDWLSGIVRGPWFTMTRDYFGSAIRLTIKDKQISDIDKQYLLNHKNPFNIETAVAKRENEFKRIMKHLRDTRDALIEKNSSQNSESMSACLALEEPGHYQYDIPTRLEPAVFFRGRSRLILPKNKAYTLVLRLPENGMPAVPANAQLAEYLNLGTIEFEYDIVVSHQSLELMILLYFRYASNGAREQLRSYSIMTIDSELMSMFSYQLMSHTEGDYYQRFSATGSYQGLIYSLKQCETMQSFQTNCQDVQHLIFIAWEGGELPSQHSRKINGLFFPDIKPFVGVRQVMDSMKKEGLKLTLSHQRHDVTEIAFGSGESDWDAIMPKDNEVSLLKLALTLDESLHYLKIKVRDTVQQALNNDPRHIIKEVSRCKLMMCIALRLGGFDPNLLNAFMFNLVNFEVVSKQFDHFIADIPENLNQLLMTSWSDALLGKYQNIRPLVFRTINTVSHQRANRSEDWVGDRELRECQEIFRSACRM